MTAAGAKHKAEVASKRTKVTVSLDERERRRFEALGGEGWLRQQLSETS